MKTTKLEFGGKFLSVILSLLILLPNVVAKQEGS